MKRKIGFIGLGNMGKPMALNLLHKGFSLMVSDIREEPLRELESLGAKIIKTPRELRILADQIIMMLPGPSEVRQVTFGKNGLLSKVKPNTVLIDMSTSSPSLSREIAARLKAEGSAMLDAPVSGGVPAAEKGVLTLMVGGDDAVLTRANDVLSAMADTIIHIGPSGMGHTMKLINQIIAHTTLISICEALTLGKKAGIDGGKMFDVISHSSGNSWTFQYKAPRVLARDFEPLSTVDTLYKDLELANTMAKELGVPLIASTISQQIYLAARASGLGDQDGTSIITLFERYSKGVN